MSGSAYCAWSFKHAANSPYKDPFIARFKLLLETFGLQFSNEEQYPWKTIQKFSMDPQSLTDEEWCMTGYPFIQQKREALIKLQNGGTEFDKSETELLEDLCGDFFELNGEPRHKAEVSTYYKLAA